MTITYAQITTSSAELASPFCGMHSPQKTAMRIQKWSSGDTNISLRSVQGKECALMLSMPR